MVHGKREVRIKWGDERKEKIIHVLCGGGVDILQPMERGRGGFGVFTIGGDATKSIPQSSKYHNKYYKTIIGQQSPHRV